ncbi:MAG: tetratricopeptide repeat protein, partial [Chloroflexi bacterium]|nr:tetratricopeptide repeat protein [Chloroflexota bacterium]
EAIEQTCSQVEEQVYELARHYGLAEKVDKAYRYYRLAAAKAEASYAIGEAYAYLRRAARLLERITCEPHGEKQGEVFRARERLDLDRGQGRLLLTLGDSEKALQAFTRALETAQELADPRQEAQSLLDLAVANGRAGDWETAADLGRQSLELARASDSEHPETLPLAPQVLLSSGFFAFERGAWQEAKDSLQAALVMIDDLSSGGLSQALETGLVALRARILGNLGILYDAQGEHTKALDYFHSAADIFASLDLPLDEGRALNNLGYVYYRLGQHDKATTCFEAALARFEKV